VGQRLLERVDSLGELLLEGDDPHPDRETGPQLGDLEGLRDVIVGAGPERLHDVPGLASGRQHDQVGRHRQAGRAHLLADLDPVRPGIIQSRIAMVGTSWR